MQDAPRQNGHHAGSGSGTGSEVERTAGGLQAFEHAGSSVQRLCIALTRPITRNLAGCSGCHISRRLCDFSRDRQCRGRRSVAIITAGHQLEFDGQEQHSLADVVVQLARDSGTLRLPRLQQVLRRAVGVFAESRGRQ